MDLIQVLTEAGFARVIVLDGTECGENAASVLLAFWYYDAEDEPNDGNVWIHPYYFASQRAYEAASSITAKFADEGVQLRDHIRVKPIFARLPGFTQGRNTLSYMERQGSRFHVQIMTITPGIPATHRLTEHIHELHCGACTKCVDACPTNALEGGVFHRERCLRNWQMSGQVVPEKLRSHMGSKLIGCDICQKVCPHNKPSKETAAASISLHELLSQPKDASAWLRSMIGVNLSIPNRVLAQACLLAGCSGQAELIPALQRLSAHPSATVAEHAGWALEQLE